MTPVGNLILTSVALAPVAFVYALVAALEGECWWAVGIGAAGLVMVGLALGLLRSFKNHLEPVPLKFSSAEVADRETIGLLVFYLLPLLKTSFVNMEWVIIVPMVAIFLALALTGYNFHFNPILALFGWKFYKVGTPEGITYLLITKRRLQRVADTLNVGRLTNYTLVEP